MTTNKSKLVQWDADWYNSLSDEPCLYCLTEKQAYILGNALDVVTWRTRWQGDTSAMDLDAIRGEIEAILAMNTCNDISQQITDILQQIGVIQATIENGGIPPENTTDSIETPQYQNVSTDMQAPIGGITVPCATDAEKDALYAACAELAFYIVSQMTDFFEIFRQANSRVAELVDRAVSAVPLFETLPLDEAVELVEYVVDEAVDIWEAVNTSDRLQDFTCLLFCAALANDCTLTAELVLDVIAAQAPITLQDFFVKSARDIISVMVLGQPIGDEFYYSQLYLQVQIVLLGERFIDASGWRPYEMRFLSGLNSPDHDWSIFCTDCPAWAYYEDWRFWTDDASEWTIIDGTYNGEFFEGTVTNLGGGHFRSVVTIETELDTYANVKGIGIEFGGDHDCSTGGMGLSVYDNMTSVGGFGINPTIGTQKQRRTWGTTTANAYFTGNKLRIQIVSDLCNGNPPRAYVYGVRAWYHQSSERKGHLTLIPPSTVANGDTNTIWWASWQET